MKRAVELFTFEGLPTRSPHISMAWQTHSDPEPHEAFMSVAITHWQMVVTRQAGATTLSVQGPETTDRAAPVPADAEFFGIVFSLGTYVPRLACARWSAGVDAPDGSPPRSGSTARRGSSRIRTTPTCSSTGWSGPGWSSVTLSSPEALAGDVYGVSTRSVDGGWPGRPGSPGARSARSGGPSGPSRRWAGGSRHGRRAGLATRTRPTSPGH